MFRSKNLSSGRGQELFLVALVVYASSAAAIISAQDGTHFALTWSIATSHSFSLGNGLYAGVQYITRLGGPGNNIFSSLPPGLSFYGFGIAEIIHSLLPSSSSSSSSALVSEYAVALFSALVGAVAVYFFYIIARLFGSERVSSFLAMLFAFGTGMWIYSRVYLPEGLATLLGMGSVYCILVVSQPRGNAKSYPILLPLSSGVALGLMYTVDNMGIFFLPPLVLFLFAKKKLIPTVSFLEGFVLGATPFAYYDISTTGNLFTAPYGLGIFGGVPAAAYAYSNLLSGFFGLLISPMSGLFLFSPFLLVMIIASRRFVRERFDIAALFIALFIFTIVPFALQNPSTYLHNIIGPSELILGLPYLLLLGIQVGRIKGSRVEIAVATSLGIFSFIVNGIAALTAPIINPVLGNPSSGGSLSSFLQTDVQLFQIGRFSAWWAPFPQAILFAYLIMAFPIFVLLVYSADLYVHRRLERLESDARICEGARLQ